MSPGAELYSWFVAVPMMIRSSNTRPGVADWTAIFDGSRPRPSRRSTPPFTPNDVIVSPVLASSA
jgi:hypothetical protein